MPNFSHKISYSAVLNMMFNNNNKHKAYKKLIKNNNTVTKDNAISRIWTRFRNDTDVETLNTKNLNTFMGKLQES